MSSSCLGNRRGNGSSGSAERWEGGATSATIVGHGSAVCRLNLPWGPRAPSSGNGDVRGPTSQRNI